jgi:hypothetical protein
MYKFIKIVGLSNISSRNIIRVILGLTFSIAGLLKLLNIQDFYASLELYQTGFPDLLLRYMAISLPGLEFICGVLLLIRIWQITVSVLIAFLSFMFVVILGQALVRGLDIDCGCFGKAELTWMEQLPVAFARAILLLTLSIWITIGAVSEQKQLTGV